MSIAMAVDGRAVANFILDYADRDGREVSNLSLQKLVYFCHVWSLVKFGKPLIRHQFEAWEFGPVLPYLFREFKRFGENRITGRATRIDPTTGNKEIVDNEFETDTESYLNETLNFYIRLSVSDLVRMSHVPGGPWHKVWHHRGTVNPGMKIDDDEIAQFYSSIPQPMSIQ